jgi:hypothetical protein
VGKVIQVWLQAQFLNCIEQELNDFIKNKEVHCKVKITRFTVLVQEDKFGPRLLYVGVIK